MFSILFVANVFSKDSAQEYAESHLVELFGWRGCIVSDY